jgi:predicted signal transduction protein with EAL and GGDEF domain
MLIAVAKRLRWILADGTGLSRINGDEFVIVLDNLAKDSERAIDQAQVMAGKQQNCFNAAFFLEAGKFSVHVSIGIYLIKPEAIRVGDALQYAELAMREAKRLGKNSIAVFTESMQAQLAEKVKFQEDLSAAIPNQLVALFQPQVNRDGVIEGAELLVRWHHPEKGFVSPVLFISIAEECGLIMPIGRWVMTTACGQIKKWQEDSLREHLILSVNVSAKEFASKEYVDKVKFILRKTGANPERLKLELAESALAEDVEGVINKMHQLKSMGLTFSLDDFGTGFSSLSYLRRMPIDQLKIDQSFVKNLGKNNNYLSIVKTVISLGKNLSVGVMAEGVEEEKQKEILKKMGCNYYQWYLYGRPMQINEFMKLF